MSKDSVFTMTLEPELRTDFIDHTRILCGTSRRLVHCTSRPVSQQDCADIFDFITKDNTVAALIWMSILLKPLAG